jgi:hypothetical protein
MWNRADEGLPVEVLGIYLRHNKRRALRKSLNGHEASSVEVHRKSPYVEGSGILVNTVRKTVSSLSFQIDERRLYGRSLDGFQRLGDGFEFP